MLDSDTLFSSVRFTQKYSPSTLTLTQTNSIWLKLIHSHSNWWRQPSWILPCWIQTLPSWIQTPSYLLSNSLQNTLPPLWFWLKLIQSDSNLFILTPLDDGSHLEFYHVGLKNFTHSFWLNLMIAVIWNSAMLDSDTLFSSLRFTQKHSPSTLNQTNSIWLTWWWLPSWILPSWIQPFCTKLWLKLIQSDSNSFILTQLDDGSHLEFGHLKFGHLEFSQYSFFLSNSLTLAKIGSHHLH